MDNKVDNSGYGQVAAAQISGFAEMGKGVMGSLGSIKKPDEKKPDDKSDGAKAQSGGAQAAAGGGE